MSGRSVESVWIPSYSTGVSLRDLGRESSVLTAAFQPVESTCSRLPAVPFSRSERQRINTERSYITAASDGLHFSDDVVQERSFSVNPLENHFKSSRSRLKRIASKQRVNDTSYLSKPVAPISYLRTAKPEKSNHEKSESAPVLGRAEKRADVQSYLSVNDDFGAKPSSPKVPLGEELVPAVLDKCFVQSLSANTVRWLAQNPATPEDTRNHLHKMLDAVHGPSSTCDRVELVYENDYDTDTQGAANSQKKPWLSEKNV